MDPAFDRTLIPKKLATIQWRRRFGFFGNRVTTRDALRPVLRQMWEGGLVLGSYCSGDVKRIAKSCLQTEAWQEAMKIAKSRALLSLPLISSLDDYPPDIGEGHTIDTDAAFHEARRSFLEGLTLGRASPETYDRLDNRFADTEHPLVNQRTAKKEDWKSAFIDVYEAWLAMMEQLLVFFVYINPAHSDGLVGMSVLEWIDDHSAVGEFKELCSHCGDMAVLRRASEAEVSARSTPHD